MADIKNNQSENKNRGKIREMRISSIRRKIIMETN